jgi:hypothetical protein
MFKKCYIINASSPCYEMRWCIQKFPDWVDNEIYAYNNKHSLRSNTKDLGGRTH